MWYNLTMVERENERLTERGVNTMTKNELQAMVDSCKTGNQALKALAKNGVKVIRDNSAEVGCFSVWVSDTLRIYKPVGAKCVRVQEFRRVEMNYSGVPTYFG